MDLLQVAKALSNGMRLRLLQLIAEKPDSASAVHQRYIDRYNDQKHRESIYRALETLVDADLLTKQYEEESGLIYSLSHEQLVVDLQEDDVRPISVEQDDKDRDGAE